MSNYLKANISVFSFDFYKGIKKNGDAFEGTSLRSTYYWLPVLSCYLSDAGFHNAGSIIGEIGYILNTHNTHTETINYPNVRITRNSIPHAIPYSPPERPF